jgi:hypothetical protein
MRTAILAVALAWGTTQALGAQLEFLGEPVTKIEISNGVSSSSAIQPAEAREYRAVITREGDQYFWASRGKIPMIRLESGDYVTYVAVTGRGYVRTLAPAGLETFYQLPSEAREKEFTYTEHLVDQLGSITYFGR